MVRLGPERVLLVIGGLEDIDAENKDGTHCRNPRPAQMHGVGGGVAALGGVQERNPGEIAEGEHEAQSVGGNVHPGRDAGSVVLAAEHIVGLNGRREDNAVGDVAVVAVLLGDEGQIQQDPPSQTGTDFAPGLDVDFPKKWQSDAGV